jgi:hypothetical protein
VSSLTLQWADPSEAPPTPSLRRLQGSWSGPASGDRVWVRDADGVCVGRGELAYYEDLDKHPWLGRRTGIDALVRVAGARMPLYVQLVAADGSVLAAGTVERAP